MNFEIERKLMSDSKKAADNFVSKFHTYENSNGDVLKVGKKVKESKYYVKINDKSLGWLSKLGTINMFVNFEIEIPKYLY